MIQAAIKPFYKFANRIVSFFNNTGYIFISPPKSHAFGSLYIQSSIIDLNNITSLYDQIDHISTDVITLAKYITSSSDFLPLIKGYTLICDNIVNYISFKGFYINFTDFSINNDLKTLNINHYIPTNIKIYKPINIVNFSNSSFLNHVFMLRPYNINIDYNNLCLFLFSHKYMVIPFFLPFLAGFVGTGFNLIHSSWGYFLIILQFLDKIIANCILYLLYLFEWFFYIFKSLIIMFFNINLNIIKFFIKLLSALFDLIFKYIKKIFNFIFNKILVVLDNPRTRTLYINYRRYLSNTWAQLKSWKIKSNIIIRYINWCFHQRSFRSFDQYLAVTYIQSELDHINNLISEKYAILDILISRISEDIYICWPGLPNCNDVILVLQISNVYFRDHTWVQLLDNCQYITWLYLNIEITGEDVNIIHDLTRLDFFLAYTNRNYVRRMDTVNARIRNLLLIRSNMSRYSYDRNSYLTIEIKTDGNMRFR